MLTVLPVLLVAGVVILATPSGAAPSGNVDPSTVLTHNQVVHVTATGFESFDTIKILECKAAAIDATQCAAVTSISVDANAGGNVDANYTIKVLPNSQFPSPPINCNATENNCALFVGIDFNNFSAPKFLKPISFSTSATTSSTDPPTTTSTLAPTSTTGGTTTTTSTLAPTSTTGGTTTTTKAGGTTTTTKAGGTTTTTSTTSSSTTATTAAGAGIFASSNQSTSGGSSSSGGGAGAAAAATSTTATTSSAASSGAQAGGVSAAGVDDGDLASTGVPSATPWLALSGLVMLVIGSAARRAVLLGPPGAR